MVFAKVKITGAYARTEYCKSIPKGIVGAEIELEYSGNLWDRLEKKVVFDNGFDILPANDRNGISTIPASLLGTVGARLRVGVCGVDKDNNEIIPTLWAELTVVQDAVPTSLSDEEHADPGHPVWAQIENKIGNLDDLKTQAKDNLVAALNELVSRGSEIDAAEVQRVIEEYLEANIPEVELPDSLHNPHLLRFTGAVEASYDGSEEVTVEIPQGGEKGWKLIADIEITESVQTVEIPTLPNGEPYEISELMFFGAAICKGTADRGINIKNDGFLLSQLANAVNKAGTSIEERRFYCELVARNGLVRGIYTIPTSSAQQASGPTNLNRVTIREYAEKITSLSVEIGTTADSFAVGTWFKIWGR